MKSELRILLVVGVFAWPATSVRADRQVAAPADLREPSPVVRSNPNVSSVPRVSVRSKDLRVVGGRGGRDRRHADDRARSALRIEGRGKPKTRAGAVVDAQARLGAARAARVIALAHAAAMSAKPVTDGAGLPGRLQTGRILVRGRVRGFREVESVWDADRQQHRVVLECPRWGVESVTEVFPNGMGGR